MIDLLLLEGDSFGREAGAHSQVRRHWRRQREALFVEPSRRPRCTGTPWRRSGRCAAAERLCHLPAARPEVVLVDHEQRRAMNSPGEVRHRHPATDTTPSSPRTRLRGQTLGRQSSQNIGRSGRCAGTCWISRRGARVRRCVHIRSGALTPRRIAVLGDLAVASHRRAGLWRSRRPWLIARQTS